MFFNESREFYSTLDVQASETGLTPDAAGAYQMIAESTEEWYNLREKMMKVEHVSILREDAGLLQEGANAFFKKVSDFFKKMLAKIKEIWKKFTVAISNAVMGDKEFIKKYEKALRNKSLSGFETKGRKWNKDLGTAINISGVTGKAQSLMNQISSVKDEAGVKKLREELDEKFEDEVRGALIGGSSVDSGDFKEELRKKFFVGGDADSETLESKDINIKDMMDTVKEASKSITQAQKEETAIEKLLENAAKYFDKVAKELEAPNSDKYKLANPAPKGPTHSHGTSYIDSNDKGHSISHTGSASWTEKDGVSEGRVSKREAASLIASGVRKCSTIASAGFGELITAIKERRNEYRSILAKIVTYKPKSESYDFANESSSVLDLF